MADPSKQGLLIHGFTRQKLNRGELKPPPTAAQLARIQLERDQAAARKDKRQADEEAAISAHNTQGPPDMPRHGWNLLWQ